MTQPDLSEVFRDLFTAPIVAAVNAEAQYRSIWAQWLTSLKTLMEGVKAANKNFDESRFITSQLDLAPVMRLEARIDVGVSMRITSMRQSQFGGSFGLQVSVLQAAGNFSNASQDTQESVLHARATYALANTKQTSLKDYLDAASLTLTTAADFDPALKYLSIPTPAAKSDAGPAPKALPEK